jgi:hypothetical protein
MVTTEMDLVVFVVILINYVALFSVVALVIYKLNKLEKLLLLKNRSHKQNNP